mmetsp:Transcript_9989/g.29381  ORF Transcript_9989/g.29381 Transcript_9989/m.29381 type:complete len:202 (+) Transcript_9989:1446-2051(+)
MAILTAFSHAASSASWSAECAPVTRKYESIAREKSRPSSSWRAAETMASASDTPPAFPAPRPPDAAAGPPPSGTYSPFWKRTYSALISWRLCGRNSRVSLMASCQRPASLKALTASSGFLARMKRASARTQSLRSMAARAWAQSTSATEPGSAFSATRMAETQSCWCTYMSMASLGLSAATKASSASLKRPSSSRNMAYLR